MARRCAYCDTKIGEVQRLCSTCNMGIAKYPEQNAVIVDAYLDAGFAELAAFLEHHADFHAWIIDHGGTP